MTLAFGSSDSDRNEQARGRRQRKALRRQERSTRSASTHSDSPDQGSVAVEQAPPPDEVLLDSVLSDLQLSDDVETSIAASACGDVARPEPSPAGIDPAELAQLSTENDLLKNDLIAKEELITALTDRLEQAAEQLDRLRRSGADRGWRGGGGVPSDVIQDQRAAVEELKQIAARFDEIQAATTLGRLEMQVSELRDLIVTLQQPGPRHESGGQRAPAFSGPAGSAPFTAPKPPSGSWWDRQKAAMLDESPPDETAVESAGATESDDAAEASYDTGEDRQVPDFIQFNFDIPDLPPEPDWESLTLELACEHLRVRDALLIQLREPLVQARMANLFAQGFGSIELLPNDLRTELADLCDQWEVRFRKHETELSIERARLAREQMQAKQLQEQLRKQLAEAGSPHGRAGEGESRAERRWFRFMGQQDRNGGQGS